MMIAREYKLRMNVSISIAVDKTTVDWDCFTEEKREELEIKIHEVLRLYDGDYVSIDVLHSCPSEFYELVEQQKKSVEELYEEPTGEGWEKPDDPFESIGYFSTKRRK